MDLTDSSFPSFAISLVMTFTKTTPDSMYRLRMAFIVAAKSSILFVYLGLHWQDTVTEAGCSIETGGSCLDKTVSDDVLGAWGSMVTARDATSDISSCPLKASPFVDTTTVNNGLLTV